MRRYRERYVFRFIAARTRRLCCTPLTMWNGLTRVAGVSSELLWRLEQC